MFTAIITRVDGSQETVDIQVIDGSHRLPVPKEVGGEVRDPVNLKPVGAKRLPQVGEVWRNRNGALVAVMGSASILDGGYNVVTLTRSESARHPGHVYVVNLDGNVHWAPRSPGGGDLISYVTHFDRD